MQANGSGSDGDACARQQQISRYLYRAAELQAPVSPLRLDDSRHTKIPMAQKVIGQTGSKHGSVTRPFPGRSKQRCMRQRRRRGAAAWGGGDEGRRDMNQSEEARGCDWPEKR